MIFYGHGTPPQDEVLYKNYFSDSKYESNGYYCVECGASGGAIATHFFGNLGWTCINIEASKYAFQSLKDYRNEPNCINMNIALSDKEGAALFKDIISAPGGGNDNGSLSHTEKHLKELNSYGCKFEDYYVNITRYDTLIGIPIQAFVLDVEGHELEVIKGMTTSKFLPKVMCVEYPITGLHKINDALFKLGYRLNFVSCNNAYYSFIDEDRNWFGATERMPDL